MYLALSGGGMGGLAIIGAYKALLEQGYKFRGYSGTSIGALLALAFSLGYTPAELLSVAYEFQYSHIEDLQILGLLENLGFDRGRGITSFLKGLIKLRTGSANSTFKDHYILTGKILQITTFCVEDDCTVYLDHIKTPQLPLWKGVFMSIAVPWVIAAVRSDFSGENKTYVDGGYHDPLPICGLPVDDTIGIRLNNNRFSKGLGHPFINHTASLVSSLLWKTHSFSRQHTGSYQIIDIVTEVSMFSIGLTRLEREALVQRGYRAVQNHYSAQQSSC